MNAKFLQLAAFAITAGTQAVMTLVSLITYLAVLIFGTCFRLKFYKSLAHIL